MLRDGNTITAGSDRFRCPEVLFRLSLVGRESGGFQEIMASRTYIMSQFCPLSKNCAFLVYGYGAGGTAVTDARRRFPESAPALPPCQPRRCAGCRRSTPTWPPRWPISRSSSPRISTPRESLPSASTSCPRSARSPSTAPSWSTNQADREQILPLALAALQNGYATVHAPLLRHAPLPGTRGVAGVTVTPGAHIARALLRQAPLLRNASATVHAPLLRHAPLPGTQSGSRGLLVAPGTESPEAQQP